MKTLFIAIALLFAVVPAYAEWHGGGIPYIEQAPLNLNAQWQPIGPIHRGPHHQGAWKWDEGTHQWRHDPYWHGHPGVGPCWKNVHGVGWVWQC